MGISFDENPRLCPGCKRGGMERRKVQTSEGLQEQWRCSTCGRMAGKREARVLEGLKPEPAETQSFGIVPGSTHYSGQALDMSAVRELQEDSKKLFEFAAKLPTHKPLFVSRHMKSIIDSWNTKPRGIQW